MQYKRIAKKTSVCRFLSQFSRQGSLKQRNKCITTVKARSSAKLIRMPKPAFLTFVYAVFRERVLILSPSWKWTLNNKARGTKRQQACETFNATLEMLFAVKTHSALRFANISFFYRYLLLIWKKPLTSLLPPFWSFGVKCFMGCWFGNVSKFAQSLSGKIPVFSTERDRLNFLWSVCLSFQNNQSEAEIVIQKPLMFKISLFSKLIRIIGSTALNMCQT